jgi:hypothetical protein
MYLILKLICLSLLFCSLFRHVASVNINPIKNIYPSNHFNTITYEQIAFASGNVTFTGTMQPYADYIIPCPASDVNITNLGFELYANTTNNETYMANVYIMTSSKGWSLILNYCNNECNYSVNFNGIMCMLFLRYNGTLTVSYNLNETYWIPTPSPIASSPSTYLPSSGDNNSGLSPGLIAAIVVCVALGVAIIIMLIFFGIKYEWFNYCRDAIRS